VITALSIPSPANGVWHLGPVPIRGYALADPDREHDAEDDRERVATDGDRPEVPDAVGRAGDRQGG